MDRKKFINSISLAGLGTLTTTPAISSIVTGTRESELIIVSPTDNKKALINPGMGWYFNYYSNSFTNYGSKLEPSDTLDYFPGLSSVYLRLPWAFIEPEEGKFNWAALDTPAQRWINKGKKVALRITAQESSLRYATPEWVKKAGARGYDWGEKDEDGPLWEPDYNDPIFIKKANNFVAAMADRYDANPNIAYIDIGHFGLWGEGHTVHSTRIEYPFEVLKKYIDMYTRHFKQTQLCISDDYVGHDKPGDRFPITDYAFSQGVTIRDDSILVQNYGLDMPSWEQTAKPKPWYHSEMAQLFWPTMPVILEHQHYGSSVRDGAWNKEMLLQSIEDYHASYMSIHWWPKEFLKKNRDIIEKINLRMGYRIQLRQITFPNKVKLGEPFNIEMEWANAGVAPCYSGGYPCITIKDESGGIVSVHVDKNFNVKSLEVAAPGNAPGEKLKSTFTISPEFLDRENRFSRNVRPGRYQMFLSLGKSDGTPILQLPYKNDDGYHRYEIGDITIQERAS